MKHPRLGGVLVLVLAAGVTLAGAQEPSAPTAASSKEGNAKASQEQAIAPPSLGDLARKVRAERSKEAQPVKVFTNADLPTTGGISVVGSPATSVTGKPGMEPLAEGGASPGESEHGEAHYVRAMGKLEARLNLHRRELAVLQQKLNLAGPQFYTDPNKELMQQYSRSDINKLTAEVDAKQQQIADDEQAIAGLRQQLEREGGDPGWLRAGARAAGQAETEEEGTASPPGTKAAAGTREYWRAKFKVARARLKNAEEEQQLAEDEVSLLETRQTTEQAGKSQLAPEVSAKQTEVEQKRAATAKAKAALEALEEEFKQSGAPSEWIKDIEPSND
ncbi:MAG TPA: hypothetical protein VJV74_09140 [Terriglobia bacterium]|nr:hypothetical protein [Terriglobia bacterium]